jgi:hypothetical protein
MHDSGTTFEQLGSITPVHPSRPIAVYVDSRAGHTLPFFRPEHS